MAITYHKYKNENLDEMAAFIARLNTDPLHHIAYLDTEVKGVVHNLDELVPPLEETFLLAREGERLVGVMGAEYDLELGRSWLQGPFVDHADWEGTAKAMLGSVMGGLPAAIVDHEIACDERNTRCRAFAEERGFQSNGGSHYLLLAKDDFDPGELKHAPELDETFDEAFQELHDRVFPGTYYNGKQLLEKQDATNRIFMVAEGEDLLGYVYASVALEVGEAYFDFIGVTEAARGRGVGSRLLRTALMWAFAQEGVLQAGLTVNTDNQAAIRLYQRAGFQSERVLLGFRKKTK